MRLLPPATPRAQLRARRWLLGTALGLAGTAALLLPAAPALAREDVLRGAQAATGDAAPTDRLIIKYRDGTPGSDARSGSVQRNELHRRARDAGTRSGLRMQLLRVGAMDMHVMKLERRASHAEVQRLARSVMAADANVEYAEPDRLMQPMFVPTDVQYGQQWHYFETVGGLNLPAAWDKSTGTGVVVGVIDTGYLPHADLAANVVAGYDFIADSFVANDGGGRDNSALDPGDATLAGECGTGSPAQDRRSSWHGTHVAGTIAAVSNNGSGVAGVAFGAKVQPLRALGKCGGYTSDIAAAIVWGSGGAVTGLPSNPTPARVLNLSLGGSGSCSTTTLNAINSARSRNTVVVVAAGNSNVDASGASPANCAGVITVAATNRLGGKSYFSNFGSLVAVAAPGGDMRTSAADGILSTLNAGAAAPGADSYAYYQGTSMATPHVAGVVALMLARNPNLTPDLVAARLKASARAFPAACAQCGSGIVDANAAVDAAAAPVTPPSTVAEVEANNSLATAQVVALRTTVNGSIGSRTDTDYYAISLPAGGALTATLSMGSRSDFDLVLYNSAGTQLAATALGAGRTEQLSTTNASTAPATYYLRVRYFSGSTGTSNGAYSLQMN